MKPRMYLDQNILGYLLDGSITLDIDDFDYVYSETHFKEFPKNDYKVFCDALDNLKARCIKCNVNEKFEIQNKGTLLGYQPVEFLYNIFIKNYNPDGERSYDGLMAYFNGSQDKEKIESFLNIINKAIDEPSDFIKSISEICSSQLAELDKIFKEQIFYVGKLEENRKKMGTDQGKLNSLSRNTIQRIFDLLEKQFGIKVETFMNEQFMNKALFLKVAGLHSFLNSVGYNPDRNINKYESIPNIRHDGEHIGYGIYCNFILSEDRRFIKKAAAIYEHLNIENIPLLLQIENKKA
jgi:hypothetical protein